MPEELKRRIREIINTPHGSVLEDAIAALVESECALRVGMALRDIRARFSDLAVEMEKHSNDHIRDEDSSDRLGAAVEGVCADRIKAILALDLASVAALDAHDSNVRYEHDLETMKMLSGIGVICVRSHEDTEPFAEALRKALDAHDAEVIEKFVASIRSSPEDMKRHDAEVARKARLDEAKWWSKSHGHALLWDDEADAETHRPEICTNCLRIAELSRPAAESEAGK